MKWDAVSFACLAATAAAAPQAPAPGGAPAGCSPSYDGEFQISAVKTNGAAKRDIEKRYLAVKLQGGVLTDQQQRTGYIADNFQFQFDGPPQAGALSASGFSACEDGNLALGSSKVFYQCRSGEFYNLYDRNWAPQCEPINIKILANGNAPRNPTGHATATLSHPVTSITSVPAPGPVTQIGDGQIQAPASGASDAAPGGGAAASQIADGQVQAPGVPGPGAITQIGDGQVQAPTHAPTKSHSILTGVTRESLSTLTRYTRTAAPCSTAHPASQIGDGQIQVPRQVQQIPDGQIQAPGAGTPAPTEGAGAPGAGAPAPTEGAGGPGAGVPGAGAPGAGAPVTQIGDGQIQAPGEGGAAPAPTEGAGAPGAGAPGAGAPAPTEGSGAPGSGGPGNGGASPGSTEGAGAAPPAGGAIITQIDDGQIQVPTGTGAPVHPPMTGTPGPVPTPTGSTTTVTICPTETPIPAPAPPVETPAPAPPVETPAPAPPARPPAGPVVTETSTYCPPAQTPQPPPPATNGTTPQPPPQQQPTVAPVPGSGEKLIPGTVAALAVGAAGAFLYL